MTQPPETTAEELRAFAVSCVFGRDDYRSMLRSAASTIDRLQAELAELRGWVNHVGGGMFKAVEEQMRKAERERDQALARAKTAEWMMAAKGLGDLTGIPDPVRPDIHELVCMKLEVAKQRAEKAEAERDQLRAGRDAGLKALGGFAQPPFDGSLVGGITALSWRIKGKETELAAVIKERDTLHAQAQAERERAERLEISLREIAEYLEDESVPNVAAVREVFNIIEQAKPTPPASSEPAGEGQA